MKIAGTLKKVDKKETQEENKEDGKVNMEGLTTKQRKNMRKKLQRLRKKN